MVSVVWVAWLCWRWVGRMWCCWFGAARWLSGWLGVPPGLVLSLAVWLVLVLPEVVSVLGWLVVLGGGGRLVLSLVSRVSSGLCLDYPGILAELRAGPLQWGFAGAEAGTSTTEVEKESEGEGLGVGSGLAGRWTLSCLIVLAVLRWSVRLAGLGAVGIVGLGIRGIGDSWD